MLSIDEFLRVVSSIRTAHMALPSYVMQSAQVFKNEEVAPHNQLGIKRYAPLE